MKRTTWTLIIAALLTGGLGLHVIVTAPLHRQIVALTGEMDDLQHGMRKVADFRDDVAGTNDLLSGLEAQSRRIDHARAALDNLRRFEREVKQQSESAVKAMRSLDDIARLQSDVIAQSERVDAMSQTLDQIALLEQQVVVHLNQLDTVTTQELIGIDEAESSLRQLGDFHHRVTMEADGLEVAEQRFEQLVDLKASVENTSTQRATDSLEQIADFQRDVVDTAATLVDAEMSFKRFVALKSAVENVGQTDIEVAHLGLANLAGLKRQVIADGQQAVEAQHINQQLLDLQNNIIDGSDRIDVAHKHASQLLNLEDKLANDANQDIDGAARNLAALLEIEESLASQDDALIAAVESLELMQDLQSEFRQRTQELDSIRRGLTELVMMESLVARTVSSLAPLTELTNLHRMDASQLRSIARSMMEDRPSRIAREESAYDGVPIPPTR